MDHMFPIPLTSMAKLKGMLRIDATSYLTETYPHLDEADMDALLRLAMPAEPPTTPALGLAKELTPTRKAYVVDPTRSHFILGATLVGVSQYQLAGIFSVARQTIYSILRRVRRPEFNILQRQGIRYSDSEVRVMHDWYSTNRTWASELTLLQLVAKLESVALDARNYDPSE